MCLAWLSARMSHVKAQAASIEREIRHVVLVLRDPRTPWYCKAVAGGAIAYNLSPVTLIPDWIPVIGLLDNLFVLGLGVWLVETLAPQEVLRDCRQRSAPSVTELGMQSPRMAKLAVIAVLALKVVVALIFSGIALLLLRSTPLRAILPGG